MPFSQQSAKTAVERRWEIFFAFREKMVQEDEDHYNGISRVCIHESGHIVCYWYLHNAGTVVDVTVIPSEDDDYEGATNSVWPTMMTLAQMRARMLCLLGGERAELMHFDEAIGHTDSDLNKIGQITGRASAVLLEEARQEIEAFMATKKELILKLARKLFVLNTMNFTQIRRVFERLPVSNSDDDEDDAKERRYLVTEDEHDDDNEQDQQQAQQQPAEEPIEEAEMEDEEVDEDDDIEEEEEDEEDEGMEEMEEEDEEDEGMEEMEEEDEEDEGMEEMEEEDEEDEGMEEEEDEGVE
ncbi:hypothetical protein niasHS_016722 [Heterodera schachtii]|uniref:Peptidase M41 domain-containing protein n=1 Tax=Heterodera schachtii TaxID=97005 RepID=A0ABD2I5J1_HETSC